MPQNLPSRTRLSCLSVIAFTVVATGCGESADDRKRPLLVDAADASGLVFHHFNGMSGRFFFSEMTGAGAALFDMDGDGDLDAYLVQGRMLGTGPIEDATFAPQHPLPLVDRIYRNDLGVDGAGRSVARFVDITDASGLRAAGYGMGVAVGDADNDGWPDLYITNFGPNQLWRNHGPGADGQVTFTDVTAASGTGDPRWSTSAAWLDYDRDGWLDLYVANYVDYRIDHHKPCLNAAGAPGYCGPQSFSATPDRLFHNLGVDDDGQVRFEDVSAETGIDQPASGLGVVVADFDADGWPDIYVANDLMRNHLWSSRGPGADGRVTFENIALAAGCAVDRRGRAQASMGIDAGDLDNDGDEDLFMSHLSGESNTLYRNLGEGQFEDATASSQLGAPSIGMTGFGAVLLDIDRDSWLDVLVVNGAVRAIEALERAGDPLPLRQPNQLFRNVGSGIFEDITEQAPDLAVSEVSRGAAVGDVDNDGDPDVLVANNAGPARLFLNQATDGHFVGLRLVSGARDALGALVAVSAGEGARIWRRVRTAASFCSSNDPRLLVGLGDASGPVRVEARWPSGLAETWDDVMPDAYTTLVEGTGVAVEGGGQ